MMLSIVVGVVIGTPLAVAICFAAVSGAIHIYPQFTIPGKLINMGLLDVLTSVSGIFFCSSIMAGGVWFLGQMLPPSLDHVSRLLLQVPFGIVTYMLLAYTLKVRTYVSILSLIRAYGLKT